MALTIGSNIASLRAQRQLGESATRVAQTYERLSSGMRINRASDDAAGLSLSSQLKADTRVYNQAVRNVNDGLSAVNIAQGAMQQLSSIVTRIKELATEAASGTLALTQRRSLDKESAALTSEYNRIIESTSYNGIKLLEATPEPLSLQLGYGSASALSQDIATGLERVGGTGSFNPGLTIGDALPCTNSAAAGDIDGDGITDLVTGANDGDLETGDIGIFIGNGDGTFQNIITFGLGEMMGGVRLADLDNDGALDIVASGSASGIMAYLNDGQGNFTLSQTFSGSAVLLLADLNNDGKQDIKYSSGVRLGNGDGSFGSLVAQTVGITAFADFNGDNFLDVLDLGTYTSPLYFRIYLGDGTGGFQQPTSVGYRGNFSGGVVAGDFNHDGNVDVLSSNTSDELLFFSGDGSGGFAAPVYTATDDYIPVGLSEPVDLNADGNLDVISGWGQTLLGRGDGSFLIGAATFDFFPLDAADLNNDGVLDIIGQNKIALAQTESVTSIARFDLTTVQTARQAMDDADVSLDRISRGLSIVGAFQSRLGSAAEQLRSTALNLEAAEARISNADIADETAKLVRNQIAQQAAAAVVAQANQQPSLVLSLLGKG